MKTEGTNPQATFVPCEAARRPQPRYVADLTGCREGGMERCYRKLCVRNTTEADILFVDIKKVFLNDRGLFTPLV